MLPGSITDAQIGERREEWMEIVFCFLPKRINFVRKQISRNIHVQ